LIAGKRASVKGSAAVTVSTRMSILVKSSSLISMGCLPSLAV